MHFNDSEDWESLREKIIGLGESSIQKSYYPELQKRLSELERFRALLDQSNDAIFLLEIPSGSFVDANESASKQLGYLHSEMLGMSMDELVDPHELGHVRELFLNMIERREFGGTKTVVAILKDKNGREIPFEINVTIVHFSDALYGVMVARNITERKQAEDKIKASLEEKSLLLQEIHHRVKNNMQIISSLLSLQSNYVQDSEVHDILKESQNRVRSMAMIHEKLYQSKDFSRVDFGEYIQNLNSSLFHSYVIDPERIKIRTDVKDILLGIDTAIPCGLLINEFVTNSIKHAFPNGMKGEINVKFASIDGKIILTVSDNGIGFVNDIDFQNTKTLGMQLINTLVGQIDGTLEISSSNGTKFRITFKEREYKDRI